MNIIENKDLKSFSKYYFNTLLFTMLIIGIISNTIILTISFCLIAMFLTIYFDKKLLNYEYNINKQINDLKHDGDMLLILSKEYEDKCNNLQETLKDKEAFLQTFEKDYKELKDIILSIKKQKESENISENYNEITNVDSDLTNQLINSKILIIKDESENISYDLIQEADFVIIAKDNRILKNRFGNIGRIISNNHE